MCVCVCVLHGVLELLLWRGATEGYRAAPQLKGAARSAALALSGGHEGLLSLDVHEEDDGTLRFDTEEEARYPSGLCEHYAKIVST